jgi:HAD superfamily hydrolase (TIGR01549 family)
MRSNKIKTVLFDLDGTLRHNVPSGGEIFTDYIIGLGLHITEEDRRRAAVWEHYYFANSPEIQSDQKVFKDDEVEFWAHFSHRRLTALGCPPPLVPELGPRAAEYMQSNYKPEVWIPDEVHSILSNLRESEYTLGLVSNRNKPVQEEIHQLGIGDYFQFSLVAGEVNSWKPDPGIFEQSLKKAGTTPEQTIYIGDNYFADVVGARRAGLQPVLYDLKGLFHEPDCTVIRSFDELDGLLN